MYVGQMGKDGTKMGKSLSLPWRRDLTQVAETNSLPGFCPHPQFLRASCSAPLVTQASYQLCFFLLSAPANPNNLSSFPQSPASTGQVV